MRRKETKILANIRVMYKARDLNEDTIYHKAKLLLSVYRDVVWSSINKADALYEEVGAEYYGSELTTALTYLTEFAPDEQKARFEARISCLFETKWMIDLIDNAMYKVHDYHDNGELYHEILSKCYLSAFKYNESDLLEMVDLERSTFYDRKKEAIMLLGIALWGYSIPQFQGIFSDNEPNEIAYIPDYFMEGTTESRLSPD